MVIRMRGHEVQFERIFERLPVDGFRKDPSIILSYMLDFGFDPREVRILRIAISDDRKRFQDAISCPDSSVDGIVSKIADYCYVSEEPLASLVCGIREALNGPDTEIVEDDRFGKCRISADGVALYSLDMKTLLEVKDVERFSLPESVTKIGRGAFWECESLREVRISDSVTEIEGGAFYRCVSIKFIVDSENGSYSSIDGALFDKDGRILIAGHPLVHNGVCCIPDSVTEIGERAFFECRSLREVRIPDSVTEIGKSAFFECRSLREVRIPDSVTEIRKSAFVGCYSARFIVDSKNRYYSSKDGALFNKEAKTLIVGYPLVCNGMCSIPDSVTEVRNWAFDGCGSLREVCIPDSVKEIGENAFYGCDSARFIVDPNNRFYESVDGKLVTKKEPKPTVDQIHVEDRKYLDGRYTGNLVNGKRVGRGLFRFSNGICYEGDFVDDEMTGRGKKTWPNGNVYEGEFKNGRRTGTGTFTWGQSSEWPGLVYTGDFVDDEMTGRGKKTWPNGNVYEGEFKNGKRTGNGTYTWSPGLVYTGDFVDDRRTGKGIYRWPDGTIYDGEFKNDNIEGYGTKIWPGNGCYKGEFKNGNQYGRGVREWPDGRVYEGEYKNNKRTGKGIMRWPDGTVYEGDFVDGKETGKGKKTYPNGTVFEGDFVEGNLVAEKKLDLSNDSSSANTRKSSTDDNTNIVHDVKYGKCRKTSDSIALYSISMDKLLRVKDNIIQFTIPDSVTEIGADAFFGCSSLREVRIPDSVTVIGELAFSMCSSLREVRIPDSVTEIGKSAFCGCSSLQRVYIPDSVTKIGNWAFHYIADSARFIIDPNNEFYSSKDGALIEKEKRTLIVGYPLVRNGVCSIPNSVTEIGESAFRGCKSLQELHIPDSVTEIGKSAFRGCSSLQKVYIPDSVTKIGDEAFYYVGNSIRFTVNPKNRFYRSVDGKLVKKIQS